MEANGIDPTQWKHCDGSSVGSDEYMYLEPNDFQKYNPETAVQVFMVWCASNMTDLIRYEAITIRNNTRVDITDRIHGFYLDRLDSLIREHGNSINIQFPTSQQIFDHVESLPIDQCPTKLFSKCVSV